jgi:hypothetical protein
MTQLEPSQRSVVAAVVGEDVLAQDEEALAEAHANYRRTVALLQRHPWRPFPHGATAASGREP